MQCIQCSAELDAKDLVYQVGHLETFRCPQCGHENSCTVSPAMPDEFSDATPVRAVVSWSMPPTAGELLALRRVVPEFADLGIAEVQRSIANSASWSLGVHPRAYVLRELAPFVAQHGLPIEIEPA